MTSTIDVARRFTAMMAEGRFEEAGETYWAANVASIEPADLPGGIPAVVRGFDAAREKARLWFSACGIDNFKMEGPYLNGDQFTLLMDMVIVTHATGERRPFKEIAQFTVRDGKITEERYFY
ncbi:MAG TPA: nuclear transport factor 2 family protein [Opitutaceae bacterium]|nr:nuclear transport factor 2 family protein [Opitutaceae bacterium]